MYASQASPPTLRNYASAQRAHAPPVSASRTTQVWELRKASLPLGEGGADAVERQRARRTFEAALPLLADLRRHPLRCVGKEVIRFTTWGPKVHLQMPAAEQHSKRVHESLCCQQFVC